MVLAWDRKLLEVKLSRGMKKVFDEVCGFLSKTNKFSPFRIGFNSIKRLAPLSKFYGSRGDPSRMPRMRCPSVQHFKPEAKGKLTYLLASFKSLEQVGVAIKSLPNDRSDGPCFCPANDSFWPQGSCWLVWFWSDSAVLLRTRRAPKA